jgi:hypothetical protein
MMLTDLELIQNEKGMVAGPRWVAIFPKSTHFFTAESKSGATKIAREYGWRIIGERFIAIDPICSEREGA